jgi:hypothetical protein
MGISGSSAGSEVARAKRIITHHLLAKSLRMGGATLTPQPTSLWSSAFSKHTEYLFYVFVWASNKFFQPAQVIKTFLG